MKKLYLVCSIAIVLLAFLLIKISSQQYSFTLESAVKNASSDFQKGHIIYSNPTSKGETFVLISDEQNKRFGTATIKRDLFLFYKATSYCGYTPYSPEKPFLVMGNDLGNTYLEFIKTFDSDIKYIAIGKPDTIRDVENDQNLTFDEIKNDSEHFQIEETQNGQAFFWGDPNADREQSPQPKHSILGFDANKKLIAFRTNSLFGNYTMN